MVCHWINSPSINFKGPSTWWQKSGRRGGGYSKINLCTLNWLILKNAQNVRFTFCSCNKCCLFLWNTRSTKVNPCNSSLPSNSLANIDSAPAEIFFSCRLTASWFVFNTSRINTQVLACQFLVAKKSVAILKSLMSLYELIFIVSHVITPPPPPSKPLSALQNLAW